MSADDYFEELPAWSRRICLQIRELFFSTVPELRETVKWQVPCYEYCGILASVSGWKQHVSVRFHRGQELPDPDAILDVSENNLTMRSLTLKPGDPVPHEALRQLIENAMAVNLTGPRPSALKKKPAPLPVPPELQKLLEKSSPAARAFAALSTACQNQYGRWIDGAKRQETKDKRAADAVIRIRAGRNFFEPAK